jgi:hypothetical protein
MAVFSLICVVGTSEADAARRNSQMKAAVKLAPNGDAEIAVDIELPIQTYSLMKQSVGSATYLSRKMGDQLAWSEIQDLRGQFNDSENAVNTSLKQIGYAKPYAEGKWMVDLKKEDLTLVAIAGNVAHFSAAMDSEFGAINVLYSVETPAGSSNHKFNADKHQLTYDYVPEFVEGDSGDAEFEIDSKHEIMSSLAKVYGDEMFDNFWVSRSKFKNTGDQVIRDYRVRFRISNLSSWSSWKKTKVVYPGQTVIDPFFPVLDIDQLGRITDTRNAMIEVEYEYEMGGKKTSDSDSDKIKVLSRNQVLWGSRPTDQTLSWYEQFDNSQVIGAVFCNSNDPVIQQVAGAVSRMTGGQSQATDEGAVQFMRAMWSFMELNKISYQSPPSDLFDGHLAQHVKYGRDVIRNRAGTCVDLAIFWTATAKAVGLNSHLVVIPGHAFPVIELPESGNYVPIESTLIMRGTFDDAYNAGMRTLSIARGELTQDESGKPIPNAGLMISSDIRELQNSGVNCLDLPPVEDGFLLNLGYKLELPELRETGMREDNKAQVNNLTKTEQQMVGVWRYEVESEGQYVVWVAVFTDGREYGEAVRVTENGKEIRNTGDEGTWRCEGNVVHIDTKNVDDAQFQFGFTNEGHLILASGDNRFTFKKVETE